ncbi:ERMAP protein, partial [Polypterus senegalus]|nr:erythroid membrane-associated protein-like isoform X1 [Polypterus senegalus]MBN3291427.1 ERMAP protein [Polypterus senegalus]
MKMTFPSWSCLVLLILDNVDVFSAEKFVVQSPTKLVVAYIDEDVVLPAFLSPSINAKGLEVRWYKDDYSSPVHLYKHQKTENVNQLHSFKGRTELFLEELKMGNVSLTLRGLRLTDNGTYKCLVASPELTDDTQIDVTILAIGTHPSISVNTEQNLLECKAEGWNPEPDVRWADGSGANLTSKANTELLKDQNGSPHVVSLIDINRKSNVFSCLMRSKTPKPNWESKLHIGYISGVQEWMVAFIFLGLLCVPGLVLTLHKWTQLKKIEKLYDECLPVSCLWKEIKEMSRVRNAEWKRICDSAVNVTLNPDTAHSRLILTEDLKQVRLGDDLHKPNNPRHLPMCFNVLANEGFSSGSNYWEVVVGDKTRWSLGIVSEAINRDEKISVGPKKGIWLIWLKNENEYCALTDPPTSFSVSVKPKKIGVFLDYNEGCLSFYNADSRCLLHTFTDTFTHKLYPYFSPCKNEDRTNSAPLIICPLNSRT